MKTIYYDYSDYPSIEKGEVAYAKSDMEDVVEGFSSDLKVKVSGKGYSFGNGEIRIKGTKKAGVDIKEVVEALTKEVPSWSFEI